MTTDTRTNTRAILLALLGVGAIAVIALIAAVALGSSDDEPNPAAINAGPVVVTGTPLPRYATPDTAVGLPAPSFAGLDFAGEQVAVDIEGPVLVGFFAHWCPHCQAEVPVVVDWLDGDPGIDVIAVSTSASSDADNWPPSAWFEREGWDTTVVVDSPDGELAEAYGLSAFPYWVAIDASGNVVGRTTGELGINGLDAMAELARS